MMCIATTWGPVKYNGRYLADNHELDARSAEIRAHTGRVPGSYLECACMQHEPCVHTRCRQLSVHAHSYV